MPSAADRPVVFLAFANDQGEFLDSLKAEQNGVASALMPYAVSDVIQLWPEANASTDILFSRLGKFPGRLAIFHYAGHANGEGLHLDGGDAASGGLADLFGQLASSLKLIFLNGCATGGQVAALMDRGVNAVIATSTPINDTMAGRFSTAFYNALADGMTIGEAFAKATALMKANSDPRAPQALRGLSWAGKPQTGPDDVLPWGLYVRPGAEAVLDWKLPPLSGVAAELPPPMTVHAANDALRNALLDGLSAANADFAATVAAERRQRRADPVRLQQAIVDILPAPIAEQVRKLFNQSVEDQARLQQLLQAYDVTVRLFCFAALAQLWTVRDSNPGLAISDEQRALLRRRLELAPDAVAGFDDFGLIVTVMQIFKSNGVQPFMPECVKLADELTSDSPDDPVEIAHGFMQSLRTTLLGPVGSDQIPGLCAQAYGHLGVVLGDLGFVTRYFPTTIKKIEVWKSRSDDTRYLYTEFSLDRLTSGAAMSRYFLKDLSDSGCVLLQQSRFSPDAPVEGTYLNLTPFVIDQSSIDEDAVSSLFFLTSYDQGQDAYHYVSVVDPKIEIVARHVDEDYDTPPSALALNELKRTLDAFRTSLAAA